MSLGWALFSLSTENFGFSKTSNIHHSDLSAGDLWDNGEMLVWGSFTSSLVHWPRERVGMFLGTTHVSRLSWGWWLFCFFVFVWFCLVLFVCFFVCFCLFVSLFLFVCFCFLFVCFCLFFCVFVCFCLFFVCLFLFVFLFVCLFVCFSFFVCFVCSSFCVCR